MTLRVRCPGDTGREDVIVDRLNIVTFGCSSEGVDRGDESADDCATNSSASDAWPLSTDAAKLLDISGSDINA